MQLATGPLLQGRPDSQEQYELPRVPKPKPVAFRQYVAPRISYPYRA
jgi:hypothetical protein